MGYDGGKSGTITQNLLFMCEVCLCKAGGRGPGNDGDSVLLVFILIQLAKIFNLK